MRLWICAVGHARGTPEATLAEDFIGRAHRMGRNLGFPAVAVEELAVCKSRDTALRMKDEAERLAQRVPDGAHVILLDAKGKGMTSEDFAEMLAAMRDAGTRDLAFVIGGRMVLRRCRAKRRAAASLSGRRPGRILSCAFCSLSRSIAP